LECDLLRVYGVDLLDLYREPQRLTLRRLAVLIRGLPADALTVQALHVEASWSATEYLLAEVLDTLRQANWLTVELNKKKSARNPQPERVPRPGEPAREKPALVSGSELNEWLGKVG
jgi:hypothetical protein